MANKTTIGHIILKGGTSKDVRKGFPDFPLNPTKEYFCELGYKESTAKSYVRKLKKNNESASLSNSNNASIQTSDEEEIFVKSKDPDYNNLLVDTCALGNEETVELIEQAKHVTFIYSTIQEMDKQKKQKKDGTPQEKKLASNIALYVNKILEEREKYMLSAFSGIEGENYPDHILLQYMKIIPTQIRPTLITADKNLAAKAEMWDLQYILFDVAKRPKTFPLGFGIKQVVSKSGVYVDYNGEQKVSVVHEDDSETFFEGKKLKVKSGDRVCIYLKYGDNVVPNYLELK